MTSIRIIPCLDVSAGRVVKGINFQELRDSGDPVELARDYFEQGADEITLLDVSASVEGRGTMLSIVEKCAETVFIPLTVGGGVRQVDDVTRLLSAGADKVSVGSASLERPDLISEIADEHGSQVLVASLDVKRGKSASGFIVTKKGGREETEWDAIAWVLEVTRRGAGEILLNSIDADGTKQGFDLELIRLVRDVTELPIIASGGAGSLKDFEPAANAGADALLAASVFHEKTFSIADVKRELAATGLEVRV